VRVKRDKIAACMKCPLCNKLLKEATTISLCLHTCEFLQCLRFLRFLFLGLLYSFVLPTGFVLFSLFLSPFVRIVLRISCVFGLCWWAHCISMIWGCLILLLFVNYLIWVGLMFFFDSGSFDFVLDFWTSELMVISIVCVID